MGLRLILGRAGSGKSTFIYKEINKLVEEEPWGHPLWLLVPEQATSLAERNLVALSNIPGFMRARIVSFRRLAYQMLHEVSGAALVQIGEIGRHMIIRRIVEQEQQQLRTFYRSTKQPGFTKKLADLIDELKSNRISAADLNSALSRTDPLPPGLRNKLHDLSLITGRLAELYGDDYLDAADCLDLLATNVAQAPSLRGSSIWLDGFNGFTAQEYAVIEQLLKVSPRLSISLTLPPELLNRKLRNDELFYTPWETAHKLIQLARNTGIEIEQTLVPARTNLRTCSPGLRYIEANYFDPFAEALEEDGGHVQVVVAGNRRSEVEAAAAEILRLCREENYRYREISITLRDFNDYDYLLDTVLKDFDIPYFLDKKRSLAHHPLPELLRSALEIIIENYPYEPIFRCLKTDLFPICRAEVDILENFVLATGIRGSKMWLQARDWHPQAEETDGLEAQEAAVILNEARRQAADPLLALSEELDAGKNARQYTEALYNFLCRLRVEKTLFEWAELAALEGDLESASLHPQAWSAVINLFDELVAGLGDEELPLSEYSRIVDSGLEAIELGLIPPELDQVIVTSLGRSRHPEVKAALILGVSEGILPARIQNEGLFNDRERRLLADIDLKLDYSDEQQLFNEQLLIYTALTRPSHYLWLSFPLADEEGAGLLPSPVIKRIGNLLPRLPIKHQPLTPAALTAGEVYPYLARPGQALGHLAVQLREALLGQAPAPIWWDVYNYLLDAGSLGPSLQKVLDSLKNLNRELPLPKATVRRLYGSTLRASISRVERYNACPFAFFSAYGLRLRERPIYQLAALDLGNFFHEAMDLFVLQLESHKRDWAEVTDQEYRDYTRTIVAQVSPRLQNHILDSSSRLRHVARKLQRTVERSARVLGEHARRGRFRPVGVELIFGPQGQIPGLNFVLADGTRMELAGRIDRLDIAQAEDGQNYLRVIDYKSGSAKLTPLEVYYGIQLQLLTYLHIAMHAAASLGAENSIAAGALYFRIYDPLLTTEAPLPLPQAAKLGLASYCMQGFILNDPIAVGLMDQGLTGKSQLVPASIKKDGSLSINDSVWQEAEFEQLRNNLEALFIKAGNEIMAGNIAIRPYKLKTETACRFCPYRAICQFDALLPENNYHQLQLLSRAEIIEKLQEKSGGEQP